MKNKIVTYVFLLIWILVMSACSNSNKPDDITQEFWGNAIQYTLYVNKSMEDGEIANVGIVDEIIPAETNLTEKEEQLKEYISELGDKSLKYTLKKMTGTAEEERKEYDEQYAKVAEFLGESTLEKSSLDTDYIEGIIETTKKRVDAENEIYKEKMKKEFIEKYDANVTEKEVQFNMANNLEQPFYLEGTVELCNYYNYGFTNEKGYFCGKLIPFDIDGSNSWYLYFNRDIFDDVYDRLLTGTVELSIIAEIPATIYKDGQGNMAVVKTTKAYNY